MTEVWKQFGAVECSNFGNVRDIDTKRALNAPIKNAGYRRVHHKGVCMYIHRLVAILFVDNPLCVNEVNHKDENKLNNRADNLEWCTHRYNCNYGTRNQRSAAARRGRVMTDEQKQRYKGLHVGFKHSDASKQKMRDARKRKHASLTAEERSAIACKGWATRRSSDA